MDLESYIEDQKIKLLEIHKQHGTIIVGVDFDDTFFPFNRTSETIKNSERVIKVLTRLQSDVTICLFSVADAQSLVYKAEIMKLNGLPPDYVNESPVNNWGECRKPYFNIQLDDKAGLPVTIAILEAVADYLIPKSGF